MFLLFLLALALTTAAPRMARSIQRDRDVETKERGKQYIRAVQLYYRKFHAYPPSVDALVKTNEIRFLRKKYTDPITGKDDWKPIMFGQNKVPIAMGFFGQPLAGSSMAGVGPSGGNGLNGVNGASGINGSQPGGLFNSSGTGGTGSIFDSSNSSNGAATPTGSTDGSNSNSSTSSSTTGGTDSSGSSTSGTSGTSGTGTGTSTGFGSQTGQSFGGAGIIGFEPASSKQSLLIWKKKDHYNEWEFTYDPIMDMRTVSSGGGGIGQPASSTSSPVGSGTSTSGPFGSSTPSTSQPPASSSPQ